MFKALLVDDEDAILKLLSAVLGMHGFAIDTASSAQEAISKLTSSEFDVVLTDLRMESPLARFDVVRAANRLTPRPTIVILTAFPVPASEWKVAGVDALYLKGTNSVSLPEELKSLLAQRRPEPPVRSAAGARGRK
ncbi:MAG TPA: response regulator [Terriglobales bacterium]|nr:response regulator [Terriglobales bacterium]